MRGEIPIGAIAVGRPEAGAFPESHVALLRTFADQAVIAIENVRLFTELEARNGELTEALGRQTATSEILGVISRSPTDVQPVFDSIVRSARLLCEATFSGVYLLDGETLSVVGHRRLDGGGAHGVYGGLPPQDRCGHGVGTRRARAPGDPDVGSHERPASIRRPRGRGSARGTCLAFLCSGMVARSARSAYGAPRSGSSRTHRLRCCAPSPTRR